MRGPSPCASGEQHASRPRQPQLLPTLGVSRSIGVGPTTAPRALDGRRRVQRLLRSPQQPLRGYPLHRLPMRSLSLTLTARREQKLTPGWDLWVAGMAGKQGWDGRQAGLGWQASRAGMAGKQGWDGRHARPASIAHPSLACRSRIHHGLACLAQLDLFGHSQS